MAVFGGACLSGIAGLLLGAIIGWTWERAHRAWRASHPPAVRDQGAQSSAPASAPATAPVVTTRARAPLPPLRYAIDEVRVDDFVALAQRVTGGTHGARRAAAALERTTNIGAWDGTRLVGVARVLSDNAYFAALADVMVDPEYQRRGLGRELMNRAFEKTPRGALVIGATPGTEVFFQRIGCDVGPAGFTMRRNG